MGARGLFRVPKDKLGARRIYLGPSRWIIGGHGDIFGVRKIILWDQGQGDKLGAKPRDYWGPRGIFWGKGDKLGVRRI